MKPLDDVSARLLDRLVGGLVRFVLGADDPEMQTIEALLRRAGIGFVYAAAGGVRVHPGNAYRANGIIGLRPEGGTYAASSTLPECEQIVLVEAGFVPDSVPCEVGGWRILTKPGTGFVFGDGSNAWGPIPDDQAEGLTVEGGATAQVLSTAVIDHHRDGDPGFGRGPDAFLPGSSLGQVLQWLARHGLLECTHSVPPDCPNTVGYPGQGPVAGGTDPAARGRAGTFYYDAEGPSSSGWMLAVEDGLQPDAYAVSAEAAMTAAADHCLEAAYRGRCPGVDPDKLLEWRTRTRAAFQKRPVEAVLAEVEAARKCLAEAPLLDCGPDPTWPGYRDEGTAEQEPGRMVCRDLRGTHVPELPEAACREGLPYVAVATERDGRKKVVLGAASPELVRAFLDGRVVLGLKDVYGSPERGYAGGYYG